MTDTSGRRSARDWVAPGDVNAFFGLAVDNLTNLVVLAGLLVGVFGFPADLVLGRMVPGTALGVLAGDLVYPWLAIRLARRTGRSDVTAMPFGIDTPSLFGVTYRRLAAAAAVLGAASLASLVGIIHSPLETGGLFWPGADGTAWPGLVAGGYGLVAGLLILLVPWARNAGGAPAHDARP